MTRLCLAAIVVGVVLRLVAFGAHDHPRGDVQLDVGVARSLAQGDGFASGFVRGTALMAGPGPVPAQGHADQHAPLWPLLGALLSPLAGSAFGGLKLGSLLFGCLLLVLVWRHTDRLTESIPGVPDGMGALGAGLVALSFLAVDFSGNGALHAAQACGMLLVLELLSRARPPALLLGLLLGLLSLLHHQNWVLLPLPLVTLLAVRGTLATGAAVRIGLLAAAVGVAVQVPWFLRNAEVFGDPLYSVNGLYILHRIGVAPELAVQDGVSVLRFAHGPGLADALTGLRMHLAPNALYLFIAGLFVWPCLLGVVLAGAVPEALAARRAGDRRVLATILALALVAGVTVAWPATKLRFLMGLLPLIVPLGLRLLVVPRRRGVGLGAAAVALVWLGLVLGTRGDAAGGEHPWDARWRVLTVGGLLLVAAPALAWWRSGGGTDRRRELLLLSGLWLAPVLAAFVLVRWPHTSYHSAPFLPDIFGQPKERIEEREARGVAAGRRLALEDGASVVCGPLPLLAWDEPALVTLPVGEGSAAGAEAFATVLAARAGRPRPDHVITPLTGRGWHGGAAEVGGTWLDGRLRVLHVVTEDEHRAGTVVSRVLH